MLACRCRVRPTCQSSARSRVRPKRSPLHSAYLPRTPYRSALGWYLEYSPPSFGTPLRQTRRMNRLPPNQKCQPTGRSWHRYEKPQPGHRLQIDVKLLERISGSRRRLCQFTAIDDCTHIRAQDLRRLQPKSAISLVDELIRRLPFRLLVLQTDNGTEFQSNSTGTWRNMTSAMSTPD
jgi:hypothetical protein